MKNDFHKKAFCLCWPFCSHPITAFFADSRLCQVEAAPLERGYRWPLGPGSQHDRRYHLLSTWIDLCLFSSKILSISVSLVFLSGHGNGAVEYLANTA